MSAEPFPPPGWYPDSTAGACLRWWDGRSWTAHLAIPLPSPRPALWSWRFAVLVICWLVTLAAAVGIAIALAAADRGRLWPASVPLLAELVLTLGVGGVLGWRRQWQSALALGASSSVLVLGVFMASAAVSTEPAGDDAAGAGFVILGVPTIAALVAVVLAGAVVGAACRRVRTRLRRPAERSGAQ